MNISQLYRGLAHHEMNQSPSSKPEGGVLLEIIQGPNGPEEILLNSDHRRCHAAAHDNSPMEFDSFIHILDQPLEHSQEGSAIIYLTTCKLRHDDCIYIMSRGVTSVIQEVQDK